MPKAILTETKRKALKPRSKPYKASDGTVEQGIAPQAANFLPKEEQPEKNKPAERAMERNLQQYLLNQGKTHTLPGL